MKKNIICTALSLLLSIDVSLASAAEGIYAKNHPVNMSRAILPANENTISEEVNLTEEIIIEEIIVTEENSENQVTESPKTEQTPIQPSVNYTESDLYWLSRLIEAEASGESFEGKAAVGGCVINRVKSSTFPNTVYGVIFDRKHGVQYQPTANGAIYNTPSYDSINAAKLALTGTTSAGNALYFCSVSVAPHSWAASNRAYLKTIGNHMFFL